MAKTQRAAALLLAALFLFTSLATTGYVIWQMNKKEVTPVSVNDPDLPADMRKQLEEAQAKQKAEQNGQQTTPQEGKLKGTKLAGFTPITTPITELQVIDLVEGTGATVPAGATITAHYTGAYVVNGEIFESSKDSGQPATFPLSGVIAGWTEGVPGMKVGGTRRLIIPGSKAYGDAPDGYTPGSTGRPMGPLVFDIELTSIGQ